MHFLQKQSHYFANDPRTSSKQVSCTSTHQFTVICSYCSLSVAKYYLMFPVKILSPLKNAPFVFLFKSFFKGWSFF